MVIPTNRGILSTLRDRHIVRWCVAYIAAAWVALQAAELVFDIFGWPDIWLRALTLVLVFGFLIIAVLAWFHGERGEQRVTGAEILLIGTVVGVAVFTLKAVDLGGGATVTSAFNEMRSNRVTASDFFESGPSWSPDSSAFVFASERSGNIDLWIRQSNGEQTQLTSDSAEDTQPAWSPTGDTILFVSSRGIADYVDRSVFYGYSIGGAIWSVPAFGGEPRRLVDDAYNPAWSPDGVRFAFDSSRGGSRRIWVTDADGSNARLLSKDVSDIAVHLRPAWSADGSWVVYERQPGSQASAASLVIVSADGETQFVLTDGRNRDMAPAWIGSDRIVFASDRGGAINLWQIAVDFRRRGVRGDPVDITRGAGEDFDPAVATDGSLAYVATRRLQNLWQVAVDPETMTVTGEPKRIMSGSWNDVAAAYSSDGSQLAFSSDRDGKTDIWILNQSTNALRQFTDSDGEDLQPVWSLDDSKIAFFSNERGNNDIFIKPLAGGPAVAITPAESNDINPYWSMDGTQIAFTSDRSGQSEVWKMGFDGRDAMQVSDISTLGHTARWSPDDRWLLFTSNAEGDRDIWVVSADGNELRRLTTTPTQDAHGLWSPDGKTVLYLSDHQKVFARPFEGEEHRLVYDLGEPIDFIHMSPDGTRFVFTRLFVESDVWLIE
jgi:Tol biopolymer transport system component